MTPIRLGGVSTVGETQLSDRVTRKRPGEERDGTIGLKPYGSSLCAGWRRVTRDLTEKQAVRAQLMDPSARLHPNSPHPHPQGSHQLQGEEQIQVPSGCFAL